ncbi:MAG: SpoIID/LytB domain-containing protein [Candidatus Omnitrophica bacterium]|nr:SpoIID/LytB domain-containing protein [Candidatus Omnitrophota bacterium]
MGTLPAGKSVSLRILVNDGAKNIRLRIKGHYKIVDFESGEVLRQERNLRDTALSMEDIGSEGIRILPGRGSRVYINDRQFRGEIDIIKSEKESLFVVNHVDIEEYLYGVLYHEVSHRWPMEVLKAQAIVSRTYALYQKLVSKNKYFDLTSDIYSQVYGGRTSETWRTRLAVNLTNGQILTYNGKVFPSYYHATCGGSISDASSIWNIDIPALRSKPCSFCTLSPHFSWKKELRLKDIEDKLRKGGYNISLVSIGILKRDESGRILDLMLKGKESDIELSGNKFRLLVGPNIIKSTNFEVEIKNAFIAFYGKGWGHGIGMCQWGAYNMSRKGWKVDQILEYYYPETEIVRVE